MTKHRPIHQHAKTQTQPVILNIHALTHDGRGIASYDDTHGNNSGKKVFVDFALPNETVKVAITGNKKSFDEGRAIEVLSPSTKRQMPFCRHFGVCGGCSLQHLHADEQLKHKQSVLANHLTHHAKVTPNHWLTPVVGKRTGYRTKARLGVRYLPKSGQLIVGFRKKNSNFLTDIDDCPILDNRINHHLKTLKATLAQLKGVGGITHLEFATGDESSQVAMVIRHTQKLNKQDRQSLIKLCQHLNWQLYLQPHGENSVHRIDSNELPNTQSTPPSGGLFYQLPNFDIRLECSPLDFTQVNLSVNSPMVLLACDLLDLQKGETVLDLFCGLGNFSLPLARCVGETGRVIGVEGSAEMVKRATMNAAQNGICHAEFYTQDLSQDFSDKPWAKRVDALLIDPPRSGAATVMAYLGNFQAKRIVYVSCDPITLARDTATIIAQGYRLTHAGVMDMFCHTGHVESIARFEKIHPISPTQNNQS
ncbi:23S rRNA (uracil(1939)-C(5))-methyltransferase RlmD [Moraxella haemolytica]|uniref:23S rRNA (uracil(1939)-C(5))-methyltransferase RlmD n=1 Tax=Moraxella haemolytica TaxID=2904119 RepID=UPI002543873D|nr:23S rRNA (uracil(1939)-C(5))-methyltransferase RlmD [Moraxella sp. ZY171148]WII95399.1 23S rRNA (uracil(1939)-C(5))-methyltransferase RlmD [Moraxella sp. ZY171148]